MLQAIIETAQEITPLDPLPTAAPAPASPVALLQQAIQSGIGPDVLDRSFKSHNHYFAALSQAWANLPEHLAERFPTPEHLRKYALIKIGLYDSRSIVAANKTQARELVRFIQPMDEFSIVTTNEATVTIYTARSQSTRAMNRADFAASKQAVLDFISDLIGTTPNQLTKAVKEVA